MKNPLYADDVLFDVAGGPHNPVLRYGTRKVSNRTANYGTTISYQSARSVQRIRKDQTDQSGIHTSCDQRNQGQHRNNENDARPHKLQPHSQPTVDRDAGQVTNLVRIDPLLMVRQEGVFLAEGTNGGEAGDGFREPSEDW